MTVLFVLKPSAAYVVEATHHGEAFRVFHAGQPETNLCSDAFETTTAISIQLSTFPANAQPALNRRLLSDGLHFGQLVPRGAVVPIGSCLRSKVNVRHRVRSPR